MPKEVKSIRLDSNIFRAYDIRGAVGTSLTPAAVALIGQSFGTEALSRGHRSCVVGGDIRLSTPQLRSALLHGLLASGVGVVDIGVVTTPILYFAVHSLGSGAGLMITGSHNPPGDNGIKMMLEFRSLTPNEIQGIRLRIESREFSSGSGALSHQDFSTDYLNRVSADIKVERPLRVVADFGNGSAGILTPQLLRRLGCDLISLYEEPDGRFPNHHPDPSRPENLSSLIEAVKTRRADIGFGFDGDGDRLGVVDNRGRIVWPDRLLMLLADSVLENQHKNRHIIFDVKCSALLGSVIASCGGVPVMCRTGHSWLKSRMRELQSPLGGEFSGHICFADRWLGTDDAVYAAARVLELLSRSCDPVSEMLDRFPKWATEPELLLKVDETEKVQIVEALANRADQFGGTVTRIDGLRIDFPDRWALVRASNTTASLSIRFEGSTARELNEVRNLVLSELRSACPQLSAQIADS